MADEPSREERLDLIVVVGGEPTADEAAAAKVVIEGMLREGGAVDEDAHPDGWLAASRVSPTVNEGHRGSWTTSTR